MDYVNMEPRPTVDVTNLDSTRRLRSHRRKVMKRILKAFMDLSKQEKKSVSKVVSWYRSRQKKLLGETDSDPNPYDSTYIFYCLENAPQQ